MRFLIVGLLIVSLSTARADEKDEMAAKQKAAAITVLKKLDVKSPAVVETADLLVCGNLPEERLKAMAELMQKQYAAIMKLLKFEMTENPPKGELTVYFFPERKQYSLFVSEVVNDRLEKDERAHCSALGTEPFVAVSVLPGEKPTDLDAEATTQLAVVLLQAKAGVAKLPFWMEEGFAKAVKWRTDPRLVGERTKARALFLAKTGKYKAADAWTATADKDRPLIAGLVMDYLAFGPQAVNFGKLLSAFRVPEGDPKPGLDAVLMGVDLTADKLDAAVRKWLLTGK